MDQKWVSERVSSLLVTTTFYFAHWAFNLSINHYADLVTSLSVSQFQECYEKAKNYLWKTGKGTECKWMSPKSTGKRVIGTIWARHFVEVQNARLVVVAANKEVRNWLEKTLSRRQVWEAWNAADRTKALEKPEYWHAIFYPCCL